MFSSIEKLLHYFFMSPDVNLEADRQTNQGVPPAHSQHLRQHLSSDRCELRDLSNRKPVNSSTLGD